MVFNWPQRRGVGDGNRFAVLPRQRGSVTKSRHVRGNALTRALRAVTHSVALTVVLVVLSPNKAAASNAASGPPVYAAPVTEAAQRFGIPELWIWRVMHAESRGNRRAVSHAGAMGLMQIMPATWSMLTSKHRLGSDPFDVRANIHAGAAYLRAMWDRYRDVRLMLAAYNAGPGRADAYAAGRRGLPAETIAYVAAIAPELGVTARVSSVAAMPAPASGWRDAHLFTARNEQISTSNDAVAQPSSPRSADGFSASAAAPHPLFVTVSGKDY